MRVESRRFVLEKKLVGEVLGERVRQFADDAGLGPEVGMIGDDCNLVGVG